MREVPLTPTGLRDDVLAHADYCVANGFLNAALQAYQLAGAPLPRALIKQLAEDCLADNRVDDAADAYALLCDSDALKQLYEYCTSHELPMIASRIRTKLNRVVTMASAE